MEEKCLGVFPRFFPPLNEGPGQRVRGPILLLPQPDFLADPLAHEARDFQSGGVLSDDQIRHGQFEARPLHGGGAASLHESNLDA